MGAVGIYKRKTAPPGGFARATTGRRGFSEKKEIIMQKPRPISTLNGVMRLFDMPLQPVQKPCNGELIAESSSPSLRMPSQPPDSAIKDAWSIKT
jgi:hypothetical protein